MADDTAVPENARDLPEPVGAPSAEGPGGDDVSGEPGVDDVSGAREPNGVKNPTNGSPESEVSERPIRVSVIGAGRAGPEDLEAAREVGTLLARTGAVVVSGGREGVMEAASRGCAEAGGWTVGILPGSDPAEANPWVRLPLPTGFGQGRNVLVVQAGEVVLAVGGAWGTLSEIALARKLDRDVGVLGEPPASGLDLPTFSTPSDAVDWALGRAWAVRHEAAEPGGTASAVGGYDSI